MHAELPLFAPSQLYYMGGAASVGVARRDIRFYEMGLVDAQRYAHLCRGLMEAQGLGRTVV